MLEGILREFWQDALMNIALLVQFMLCPVVLISLLLTTAPYGRHHRPGWGPCLPARSAWILMELPALLLLPSLVLSSPARADPAAWLPTSLWLLHYGYRTLLFPILMRPSGKTFPALLAGLAIGFNLLNGYNNGSALLANSPAGASLSSLHFLGGTLLFGVGFALHWHADNTIRRLRKPGDSGYQIPRGGLFRWVSSPQYLGEMIQWLGWAILTWSPAGLAFALFTVCNLAPRAISNQRWYHRHFTDYPVDRKILIPRIF
jgi:protein-S-isoprenylcysteine O-methyltransferase Ste14